MAPFTWLYYTFAIFVAEIIDKVGLMNNARSAAEVIVVKEMIVI